MIAVRLSLIFLLATAAVATCAQSTVDWTAIVEKASPAVVTVLAETPEEKVSGTGFFVTENGWVVTNYHVIKGMRSIRIRLHNGSVYPIKSVIMVSSNWDIALLDAGVTTKAVLPPTFPPTLKPGQPVCVIGSPLSLEGTVSTGVVSALRNVGGTDVVQITAPISPGSSGSPVLDATGKVIGVATMSVKDGQNLNMAVSSQYILNAILEALPRNSHAQNQRKRVSLTPHDNLSSFFGSMADLFSPPKLDEPILEIELSEGTYHIDEALMVTKPVVLRGAGADRTRIVSAKGAIIFFPINARAMISDVSFEYIGNEETGVSTVVAGQVTFYRCRFKGGQTGLSVSGTAAVTIDSCTVEKNSGTGIVGWERAQITVKDTAIQQNGVNGMYIYGDASATIMNATYRENGKCGIETGEFAQVTVRNSLFEANRDSGISLWGSSVAEIENNTCRNNPKYGIYADQNARLVAKGNVCEGNEWSGIGLFGQAIARLENNTCRNNQTGIYIEKTTTVALQNNNCYNNRSDIVDRR